MELLRNGRPRVVVTGIGAVTVLGTASRLWENLKAGCSGISILETVGEVRDFDPSEYIDRKEVRRIGRATQFAIASSLMAVEDAGLTIAQLEEQGERVGVTLGTTIGCFELSEQNTYRYKTTDYSKPNPLMMVNALPNMPAHYVSRYMRAFGPLNAPATACAAGTQSVGESADLIRNGRCDVVIAGGVESVLQDYTIASFDAMKVLATEYNDNPTAASRPFDANRSGFAFSEGCGVVVLESLSHALQRDAPIYAEVLGHGASSDAYHIAAIDPEGDGAVRSMKWALQDARLPVDELQYINAHGTSTVSNDSIETKAIKRLFGDHAYRLCVSSTKSMMGHAMAASGAIEAVICALIVKNRVIPPTINYETPDPDCDLDYVPNVARDVPDLKYVMSNSFGLGGQNASLVFGSI